MDGSHRGRAPFDAELDTGLDDGEIVYCRAFDTVLVAHLLSGSSTELAYKDEANNADEEQDARSRVWCFRLPLDRHDLARLLKRRGRERSIREC